jgi:hypothetical protein
MDFSMGDGQGEFHRRYKLAGENIEMELGTVTHCYNPHSRGAETGNMEV